MRFRYADLQLCLLPLVSPTLPEPADVFGISALGRIGPILFLTAKTLRLASTSLSSVESRVCSSLVRGRLKGVRKAGCAGGDTAVGVLLLVLFVGGRRGVWLESSSLLLLLVRNLPVRDIAKGGRDEVVGRDRGVVLAAPGERAVPEEYDVGANGFRPRRMSSLLFSLAARLAFRTGATSVLLTLSKL